MNPLAPAPAPTPAPAPAAPAAPAAPSGPWYAAHGVPAVAPSSLQINTYTFQNSTLEAQVFTHASFVPGWGAPTPRDNASLTWLGASLIGSLSSFLISSSYPTLSPGASTDLRAAITSKQLHAHLCRLHRLQDHLHTSTPAVLQSEKVLAELFEAYIAGIAQDLGLERWGDLYRFYSGLLSPFLQAYHSLYQQQQYVRAPVPAREKRRQELAPYTSRLMEYAAKNKLTPPRFEFESNGAQGTEIMWSCRVLLEGREVARAEAGSKLEAKHIASADAMRALPPVQEDLAVANQRRRRKEMFRRRKEHQLQQPQFLPPPPQLPQQVLGMDMGMMGMGVFTMPPPQGTT